MRHLMDRVLVVMDVPFCARCEAGDGEPLGFGLHQIWCTYGFGSRTSIMNQESEAMSVLSSQQVTMTVTRGDDFAGVAEQVCAGELVSIR